MPELPLPLPLPDVPPPRLELDEPLPLPDGLPPRLELGEPLPPPDMPRLEPIELLPLLELLEPGIIPETDDPSELALSLTCSTTREITVRAGGLRAAATPAPTTAAAPAAAAARRTIFFVRLRAAVFLPPFRPAEARCAVFLARVFAAFFPAVFRDEDFDEDLFFDDFLDELLRDAAFFDFFEERFFAAMGHSPFRSVGVGESVT